MTAREQTFSPTPKQLLGFALLQVLVMLLAVSGESLWIDEFWTAHFGALGSFKAFWNLLLVPSGSQTPLHFLHFFLWGLLQPAGEYLFRLANLPLFVAGQLAVFWALRSYPKAWAWTFLALSSVHPMVWQYANEARPYTMMFAAAQMILAYLLHLHSHSATGRPAEPLFLFCFVLGSILLLGASLLGAFWVLAAGILVLVHHLRKGIWRDLLRGLNPWLLAFLLAASAVLTTYYLSSLLQGAGASRLASSTPATVLFAAYEMLGLSGIGPSRLDLRSLGPAALLPHAVPLLLAGGVLLWILVLGLKEAQQRLGRRELVLLVALGLLPALVVLLSGFVMHWRVLGRHLIASLPLLNLILALGLVKLWQNQLAAGRMPRRLLALAGLLALVVSSAALRWAPLHSKDDYRSAAAVAKTANAHGQRVWWAAGVIGARYYGLPGDFDVQGELTSVHTPPVCTDRPGVQSVANAPLPCLLTLSTPDVVILSKPETFDTRGDIAAYLVAERYAVVQRLPAFTVWRRQILLPVKKS